MLSSSDEFSVATPDETTGKETEFSLVGSLEINEKYRRYKEGKRYILFRKIKFKLIRLARYESILKTCVNCDRNVSI